MREYDLIIIGGGASGLLLAINGKKDGIKNILFSRERSNFRWSFKFS